MGERELRTVVDCHCLAAHIGFPCVGAAFTAASGFLLPAERSADFGSTGPQVYICYAAVAANNRQELFSFTQVGGENRGAQALRDCIVESYCFLQYFRINLELSPFYYCYSIVQIFPKFQNHFTIKTSHLQEII